MIDYWLILCQLVPFIQVVLVTALEFLRDDVLVHNHMKVLKRIKKTFKLGVLLKKRLDVQISLEKLINAVCHHSQCPSLSSFFCFDIVNVNINLNLSLSESIMSKIVLFLELAHANSFDGAPGQL